MPFVFGSPPVVKCLLLDFMHFVFRYSNTFYRYMTFPSSSIGSNFGLQKGRGGGDLPKIYAFMQIGTPIFSFTLFMHANTRITLLNACNIKKIQNVASYLFRVKKRGVRVGVVTPNRAINELIRGNDLTQSDTSYDLRSTHALSTNSFLVFYAFHAHLHKLEHHRNSWRNESVKMI